METHHIFEDKKPTEEQIAAVSAELGFAIIENNIERLSQLLRDGENGVKADVNWGEDSNNLTALHLAIKNQNIEAVKVLIQYGANVNNPIRPVSQHNLKVKGASLVAEPQTYPIHQAIETNNPAIVLLLLQNGANPWELNAASKTPLEFANEKKGGDFIKRSQIKLYLESACKAKPISAEELARRKEEKRQRLKDYFTPPENKVEKDVPKESDVSKDKELEISLHTKEEDLMIMTLERMEDEGPTEKKNKKNKNEPSSLLTLSAFNRKRTEDQTGKNVNKEEKEEEKVLASSYPAININKRRKKVTNSNAIISNDYNVPTNANTSSSEPIKPVVPGKKNK